MAHFNIRQVEAFRAVITLGSMTKAAELLGISQPAVSRLMMDFQAAVGFRLFNRQRGGAEPTEDARRLFAQVEKLFIGLEELNHQVHAIKNLSSGTISIAAMGLYANGLLPEIIAKFRKSYPDIAIKLDSQPQDRIVEWVSSGRADIGVATLPIANASIPVVELLRRPALCVFHASHEFAGRSEIHARDLASRPFVSFPRGTPFRFEVDTLFDREGVDRIMMLEASTHEAVCNLVAAETGVSIVSPYSPHLRRNSQLAFLPFFPAIPISLGLIGDEDRLSVAARCFYDFVIDYVNQIKARRQAADAARTPDTAHQPT
ncbi:LysR substrate-binding domain-containing protein [Mesorhizobium sp. J428]|uniref:LysR substrate-binding domain-containing protein n=1 Tax=Mesorhizobium sp. J428 TaxID=2898440 RepID=UPI00215175ED|nr:LysR substrate-binding domain-containing protein [Mesorhizobium sp. J428]MCR5856438.1 LysR substrate-binding domain-containing protein [Mesorhizobium sp. J428]